MALEQIKALMDLFANSPLRELHLVEEGQEVHLIRDAAPVAGAQVQSPRLPSPRSPVPASAQPRAERVANAGETITAPISGVVYRAPSPGARPFVEVGSLVKAGDTVAFIEAMKTMIAVTAERDGRIGEVLAANEDHISTGQPLFRFEPGWGLA